MNTGAFSMLEAKRTGDKKVTRATELKAAPNNIHICVYMNLKVSQQGSCWVRRAVRRSKASLRANVRTRKDGTSETHGSTLLTRKRTMRQEPEGERKSGDLIYFLFVKLHTCQGLFTGMFQAEGMSVCCSVPEKAGVTAEQ
jgi:hypothetical protein